jgi:hypothetical protein
MKSQKEIDYQYDIQDRVRGNLQFMWRLSLGFSELAEEATTEDSCVKDEALPRRPLPF